MSSTNRATEHADVLLPHGAGEGRAGEKGQRVAFVGFDSTEDARRAAAAAFDALRPWLARQRRTSFVPGPRRILAERRTDRDSRLTLRGIPIGRLIEPADSARQGGYGFELMLPPGTGASAGVGAAHVVVDALAAHAATPSHGRSP
jgi:hypothetical protein